MKVIFVASGNKSVGVVSAFVQSQFESLQNKGLSMVMFPIVGHGWKSYAKSIFRLRRLIKREHPDIVHAHYSVCGVVAAFATCFTGTKTVVSILGSFPQKTVKLYWVRLFIKRVWDLTIVKSRRTANQLGIDLPVVPNGVDLEKFEIIEKEVARAQCGFEEGKKYVIWCSNPSRPEKNYQLAQQAVSLLNRDDICLVPVFDKPHQMIVEYMCGADVLLLTSVKEGSPNVIKEALACNCPIVSTDVGDVRDNTEGVAGVFIVEKDTMEDVSNSITQALSFGRRTNGREHLINIGLSSHDVAHRIIQLYKTVAK